MRITRPRMSQIKSYKEKIVPVFDKHVHGVLSPWLAASSMPAAQACALCLYDDMIEHCGTAAHKYLTQVMPSFMAVRLVSHITPQRLQSLAQFVTLPPVGPFVPRQTIDHGVHPEVCQASVYGCGVVAQLGPAQMNAGMPAIAQKLVKFVSHEVCLLPCQRATRCVVKPQRSVAVVSHTIHHLGAAGGLH